MKSLFDGQSCKNIVFLSGNLEVDEMFYKEKALCVTKIPLETIMLWFRIGAQIIRGLKKKARLIGAK